MEKVDKWDKLVYFAYPFLLITSLWIIYNYYMEGNRLGFLIHLMCLTWFSYRYFEIKKVKEKQ